MRTYLTQDDDYIVQTGESQQEAWDKAFRDIDTRGFKYTFHVQFPASGVRDECFVPQGALLGTRSFIQKGPPNGLVPLTQTKQITWRGDGATPRDCILRPPNGPAVFPENGASLYVENFTFDGSLNQWDIVTGASWGSVLGLGKNVFGSSPGQVEIQIGVGAACFVLDCYEIDHRISYGVSCNVATTNGNPQIGCASPPTGVQVGWYVHHPAIAYGATVTSLHSNPCLLTLSAAPSQSIGLWPCTFTPTLVPARTGRTSMHIQQDRFSYVHYETGTAPGIPPIVVDIRDAPFYTTFAQVDGGNLLLREGSLAPYTTTFKGNASNITTRAALSNGGLIFNSPNDNDVVFTP